MAGKTKNYTDDFKKQIVALKQSGKSTAEISSEYGLPKSTIIKWVSDYSKTGSFKAKDNRTEEENELLRLRKENAYRDWETDRKSTRLNSSHRSLSRMPSSA